METQEFDYETVEDTAIQAKYGFVVKNILVRMLNEMNNVLKEDGYVIKDQKAFRDYMASYIYRNC